MKYKENGSVGNKFRADYKQDIADFTAKLAKQKRKKSLETVERFAKNPEAEREKLAGALGWPLNAADVGQAELVERIKVAEEDGIAVYRMVFKVFSEIRFYGILFFHTDGKRRPFVISQHGGLGTPEVCSSLLETGSANYNDMTERALKYGVNVFAPQLLLWGSAYDGEGDENVTLKRRELDLRLRQCGASIAALEIGAIKQCIDYFCNEPYVDSEKIGIIGLSYGGFYTLYTAALDTRIKAAISCSFFSDRGKYAWSDWVWKPENGFFFDPEVALLAFPRSLCIAVGDKDDLFDVKYAKAELERLRLMSEKAFVSTDWLKVCVFDGGHEFIKDDGALEWLVARLEKQL